MIKRNLLLNIAKSNKENVEKTHSQPHETHSKPHETHITVYNITPTNNELQFLLTDKQTNNLNIDLELVTTVLDLFNAYFIKCIDNENE